MSGKIKIPESLIDHVFHSTSGEVLPTQAKMILEAGAEWMRKECAITARQCAIQLDVPGNGVKWCEEQMLKVGNAK